MATKRKGTIQKIFDTIGEFVRQPMSDESNDAPGKDAVRKAKRVASGPRRKPKAKVKAKAKAKVKAASRKKNR